MAASRELLNGDVPRVACLSNANQVQVSSIVGVSLRT